MKTIHSKLPDGLNLDIRDVTKMVASTLYKKRIRSLGQFAELRKFSRLPFAELLGKYRSVASSIKSETSDNLKNN